jgi:hypothetical protein
VKKIYMSVQDIFKDPTPTVPSIEEPAGESSSVAVD